MWYLDYTEFKLVEFGNFMIGIIENIGFGGKNYNNNQ